MTAEVPVGLRYLADPPGIDRARTLPAAWYADDTFHRHELQRVFRSDWVCAGLADELPPRKGWSAISVGGLPVLLVRDAHGELRAFLNVCRHRASPLCDTGASGSGTVIRCPYHAWVYRLDGTLAKASGVGTPAGFDVADFGLKPVAIAHWRRTFWINVSDPAATFDPGPLGAAIDQFPIESFEIAVNETHVRRFNWKVLLENYSENYHTPFVHPQIDTAASEDYPMVSDGRVLYAWDRPLRPSSDPSEQIRATLVPGEPGWELLAAASTDRPYDVGSYLTIWPNAMINVFPDAALVMWVEPVTATTTRVERRLLLAPGRSADAARAIVESHRLVHEQDVDICARLQRSHTAGLDADGVLATTEERGVFFVHEHLRRALAGDAIELFRVPSALDTAPVARHARPAGGGGRIEIRSLGKFYGRHQALRGIDLTIESGEFFSLLGPSGCGKTTTLRMIGGFEPIEIGSIHIDGADMAGVAPERRPVNTVFQNYALFPHQTVEQNVGFGLRFQECTKQERSQRVGEALDLVQMAALAGRRPHQLSGGQQQRVALARALVLRPKVLLLDEPLGALDAKLRRALQFELKELHREVGITFVYVTHDQEEALTMSDRLAVMNDGEIEQIGAPQEVYDSPTSIYVADFLGLANLIPARVPVAGMVEIEGRGLAAPTGTVVGECTVVARPERLRVVAAGQGLFSGSVTDVVFVGSMTHIRVAVADRELQIVVANDGDTRVPVPGSTVGIDIPPDAVRLLPC